MARIAFVRYGAMRRVGHFAHDIPDLRCGQRVVIRTDRGLEIGETLCPEARPDQVPDSKPGRILRRATQEDIAENEYILRSNPAKFKFCLEQIKRLNLPMKLVEVEQIFGGDKIIFYFTADGRVDFRQLVKVLAREYQTRIELRQIGVRDEARLLGDYEHCGRPICCRTFIQDLEPVSMRMAKNQKATLDPAKISGRCGRLMCCLRFEDQTYEELKRNLPRKGARVDTPHGPAQVIDTDILTQLVKLEDDNGRRFVMPAEEVKPLEPTGASTPSDRRPRTARNKKERKSAPS